MSWGISDSASEKEKLKAEINDFFHGLNSTCVIDYKAYNQIYDVVMPIIDDMYNRLNKELMPEIKNNDLLTFTNNSEEYTGIVVDNDKVFLHFEKEKHFLKSLIKNCVKIRRYNILRDEWETIWKADNE